MYVMLDSKEGLFGSDLLLGYFCQERLLLIG